MLELSPSEDERKERSQSCFLRLSEDAMLYYLTLAGFQRAATVGEIALLNITLGNFGIEMI